MTFLLLLLSYNFVFVDKQVEKQRKLGKNQPKHIHS